MIFSFLCFIRKIFDFMCILHKISGIILLLLGMGILYAIIGLLDLCFDLRDRLRRV